MNRLGKETSPYLLQHQHNPVDWYPWGEEAFQKARKDNKPIFLSVGYAACHWCHVMERESFEDPETAMLMNEHFVNIKVDREERPDLDAIYMNAVVATTGQGGWPMSVFLTPQGVPFFGGTYFPPVPRYNIPSFPGLLNSIAQAWSQDPENISQRAEQLKVALGQSINLNKSMEISPALAEQSAAKLAQSYDWQDGGWGQAPKFPQPMVIEFLLQRAAFGDKLALEMATHALDAMTRGGMLDLVGGGFSRYSIDDHWRIPHFEKMLYDNAQLARAYLHAFLLTRNEPYRLVTEATLDFLLSEMRDTEGGFYSSLDADSQGVEGKYYRWTAKELITAGKPNEWQLISRAFALDSSPNFEDHWILQRAASDAELTAEFGQPESEVRTILAGFLERLQKTREKRVRPATDDKVLLAWNGLALAAFAEAGRYLGDRRYLQAAQQCAEFLSTQMLVEGRLYRSWRMGKTVQPAFLEDHASFGLGLLALYQADHNERWFSLAHIIVDDILAHFRAEDFGFYDTGDFHEALLIRPKDLQDNATPCGNSMAAELLLTLAALTGLGEYHDLATQMIQHLGSLLGRHPLAFGKWLYALGLLLHPMKEVAVILPDEGQSSEQLLNVLRSTWLPNAVLAVAPFPPGPAAPALVIDRPPLGANPTAYVCQQMVCEMPVVKASDLAAQLGLEIKN